MTADEARAAVEQVRIEGEVRHDDESAHSSEDALHKAVLQAIADGALNPAELARIALETLEMDFARWCA